MRIDHISSHLLSPAAPDRPSSFRIVRRRTFLCLASFVLLLSRDGERSRSCLSWGLCALCCVSGGWLIGRVRNCFGGSLGFWAVSFRSGSFVRSMFAGDFMG